MASCRLRLPLLLSMSYAYVAILLRCCLGFLRCLPDSMGHPETLPTSKVNYDVPGDTNKAIHMILAFYVYMYVYVCVHLSYACVHAHSIPGPTWPVPRNAGQPGLSEDGGGSPNLVRSVGLG